MINIFKTLQEIDTKPTLKTEIEHQILIFFHPSPTPTNTPKGQLGSKATILRMISNDIINRQTNYYRNKGVRTNGTTWAHKLRRFLWNSIFDMWRTRCTDNHSQADHDNPSPIRQDIITRIKHIYNNKHLLTTADASLLQTNINDQINNKRETLKTW